MQVKQTKNDPIRREFERTTDSGQWETKAQHLVAAPRQDLQYQQKFHAYWTYQGRRIREQINDDRLLIAMLRTVLPRYSGPDLTLYRGENLDRWKDSRVGVCWSSSIETARMFGSGLNATKSGGLLLKSDVPRNKILSGPSEHSQYLDESEFTVDTSLLIRSTTVVESYPSSDYP